MPNEILAFDAAASNIDGSDPGTVLNIGPGTPYLLREFSAPAPPQSVQYAGSVDTEGSLPASRKHENRVLTAKITCSTAVSLRTLQDKIGKVAREGGTLKWVLPNAETVIFDLHAADTFDPAFDVTWQKNAGAYCEVQIVLVAKPYGRGPSVTLSAHPETTLPALVFTETGIKGDMPALGTLAVKNTDAALPPEKALIWGLESRYTNTGVPLFLEAEETTFGSFSFPMTGSLVTGAAGASGGATNNAIRKTSAGSGTSYYSLLYKRFVSRGVFNVYARVWCPIANTGTTKIRMRWGNIAAGALATESAVTLDSSWEGSWRLVSLGQAYARSQYTTPTAGDWGFIFEANMPTAADVIDVDYFPRRARDGRQRHHRLLRFPDRHDRARRRFRHQPQHGPAVRRRPLHLYRRVRPAPEVRGRLPADTASGS
jgi:hypothetical protein